MITNTLDLEQVSAFAINDNLLSRFIDILLSSCNNRPEQTQSEKPSRLTDSSTVYVEVQPTVTTSPIVLAAVQILRFGSFGISPGLCHLPALCFIF